MKSVYTDDFKEKLAKEANEVGNIMAVANKHNIPEATLRKWVKIRKGDNGLRDNPRLYRDLENENEQLKKLLGEKELAINILQAAIKKKNLT